MGIFAANHPEKLFQNLKRVLTSETSAINKGYGVVFDLDYGTATTADGRRDKIVINPTAANSRNFAGVLVDKKTASDALGQLHLCPPGYGAIAYVGEACTIGDLLQCDAGDNAGKFMKPDIMGFRGKGSAIALQTITAAGLSPVLLLDEDDQGMLQMLTPVAAGGAIVPSPDGLTVINGSLVSTAGLTATLADGTYVGQRKAVHIETAIGNSKTFVYTITNGIQADDSTALVSITFDALDELAVLEWVGDKWKLIHSTGATLAAV
jgi:hypothetical protein